MVECYIGAEFTALDTQKTYSAIDHIPTDAEITPKLVLPVKRDSHGHYIKHKARLVVLNNLAAKNISDFQQ